MDFVEVVNIFKDVFKEALLEDLENLDISKYINNRGLVHNEETEDIFNKHNDGVECIDSTLVNTVDASMVCANNIPMLSSMDTPNVLIGKVGFCVHGDCDVCKDLVYDDEGSFEALNFNYDISEFHVFTMKHDSNVMVCKRVDTNSTIMENKVMVTDDTLNASYEITTDMGVDVISEKHDSMGIVSICLEEDSGSYFINNVNSKSIALFNTEDSLISKEVNI